MTLRVGSLFTGYGGLDLAIGGKLVWYSEIDKAACQVLATHHPNVPNLGDITKINWSDVEPVDILTGGYPCQPFSTAGNRKGTNDERHLWPYVLDAICAIRPRYAILENVSGHLSLGFDLVLTDLAKVGLSAQWGTYRASDVGAPHRRERLFIVAYSDGEGSQRTDTGLDLAEGRRNPRGHAATSVNVAAADTSGDGHGEQLHTGTMAGVEGQATRSPQQRQRSRRESDPRGVDDAANTAGTSQGRNLCERGLPLQPRGGAGVSADAQGNEQRESTKPWFSSKLRHGINARSIRLESKDWGKYAPSIRRWEVILERPAPAPTVERNDKRRLNPQFVEWMMGLPEGWVTGHGLTAAQELKMLGNGVVPQQAHAAITQLLERAQP